MEFMGIVFGLVAFIWCFEMSSKVKKLERIIKDAGIVDYEKESLREILAKNLGKTAKLELESGGADFDLTNQKCVLVDIDETWLLVKTVKKEDMGMIRVELVKGIQFV